MNLKDHFAAVNSEEVEEILNSKPKWIVRHGLLLIVIFSVILAVLAGFIRYPDVLKTDVLLTSTSPPVKLVSRSDGKIESFLLKEGQQVKEGDIVATIASSANIQDIIYMKTIVEAFHRSPDTAFLYGIPKFNQNLQLGELQPLFTELVQTIDIYNNFKRDKGYANNIEMSNVKLKFAQKIEKEFRNKGMLLGEQLASESKKLHSHESLLKDKVIAPLEFEEIKKKYLDQKMAIDNNNTAVLENLTLQQELVSKIKDLNNQMATTENNFLINIRKILKELVGELAMWEHKYVIRTPVSGKVSLFTYWTQNQYVKAGDVLAIIASPFSETFVKGTIPLDGAGKVRTGMRVFIKLYAYPYQEYGVLYGSVSNMSVSSLDSVYTLQIKLLNGFVTSTNKSLPRQPELRGTADILTDNKTILQRLAQSLRGSFENVDIK